MCLENDVCMQNVCVAVWRNDSGSDHFPRSNTILPPAKDELNKRYREIELIGENVCFKQEP